MSASLLIFVRHLAHPFFRSLHGLSDWSHSPSPGNLRSYSLVDPSYLAPCHSLANFDLILVYILFLAFDDVGEPETPRPAIQEEKVRRERRVSAAESFSAVQAPSDDGFIFVSPNPGNSPIRESRRPSLLRPASGSAERLATWVSRRLSGRPSVPDLPYGVAGYRSSMASDALAMVRGKGEMESTTGTESIYSMYTSDDVQRLTGVVNQPVRAPRRSEPFVVPPSAPPLPKLKVSKFQGNGTFDLILLSHLVLILSQSQASLVLHPRFMALMVQS